MFEIHYVEESVAFSDFDLLVVAKRIADKYKKDGNVTVRTSTGNIIEAIRVLVSRGEIPYQEVQVHFNGEIITLNEYAEFSKWPRGFMDYERHFLREILENRRKAQKEKDKLEV